MPTRSFLSLFSASLILAGCAANPKPLARATESTPRARGAALDPALREHAVLQSALRAVQADQKEYRINAADLLELSVFQNSEWDFKQRVPQNGIIALPLIGAVKVVGLTLNEATLLFTQKLKGYLVNPQVNMLIREYGNKKIIILGEVARPGSYEMPPESKLTALQAVSLAGGFTGVAAPDRAKIIRGAEGKSQTLQINFSDIMKRGQRHKDVSLEPNDVLYVPQSFF